MVAALAADAPEITAAVSSLLQHEKTIGAGVVLGSNVFNLAALLGLGAVVAGGCLAPQGRGPRRRGSVFIGTVCVVTVAGVIPLALGLVLVLVVLVAYAIVLGAHRRVLAWATLPPRWTTWMNAAILEEELELEDAIHRGGTRSDVVTALGALVVVVVASVVMERVASTLGRHYGIAVTVMGGSSCRGHQPAECRGRRLLGQEGPGGRRTQHCAQLQQHQCRGRTSDPCRILGAGAVLGLQFAGGGVVPGAHGSGARAGLRRPGLHRWAGWLIMAAYVAFVAVITGTT